MVLVETPGRHSIVGMKDVAWLVFIPLAFPSTSRCQWQLIEDHPIGDTATIVRHAHFFDSQTGLIALRRVDNGVLTYTLSRTSDGGVSWEDLLTDDFSTPRFGVVNDTTIIASIWSLGERLVRSIDSGSTWEDVGPGHATAFSFPSEQIGFASIRATTTFGGPPPAHHILRTDDAGGTWTYASNLQSIIYPQPNDLAFIDGQHGVVVCGHPGANGKVLVTSNGGDTWAVASVPFDSAGYYRTCFVTSDIGLVTGYAMESDMGFILRSTDAGYSWSQVAWNAGAFHDIIFVDGNNGFATSGDGKVYRTVDAGLSWTLDYEMVVAHPLNALAFAGGVGYAFGSTSSFLKGQNLTTVPESSAMEMTSIHPNPVSAGPVSIRFRTGNPGGQNTKLELLDPIGRRAAVNVARASANEVVIDIGEDHPPGVYQIVLSENSRRITGRVVVSE